MFVCVLNVADELVGVRPEISIVALTLLCAGGARVLERSECAAAVECPIPQVPAPQQAPLRLQHAEFAALGAPAPRCRLRLSQLLKGVCL